MLQHRPIDFIENVQAHLDAVVWGHTDDVAVERGMMQLAQREPIRDARLPFVGIRDDVRGFEEFMMAEATNRTVLPVGCQHSLAERLLVEALSNLAGLIAATNLHVE
jgi:hypothetical protein